MFHVMFFKADTNELLVNNLYHSQDTADKGYLVEKNYFNSCGLDAYGYVVEVIDIKCTDSFVGHA